MQTVKLSNGSEFSFFTPKELKSHLDDYVIGQEDAKKTLSVAIYNHYKRLFLAESNPDIKIDKSNILLLGPTGCGKTHMIKTIAEHMGLPYYIADATTLTQAGYVGDDVESILTGLLRNSNYNMSLAEMGIVILDEGDKLAKRGANEHISRDVVGEGVQQALLKMVEGDTVGIPPAEGRKHPEQELLYINTKNILFILSGAFSGIDVIVKDRLSKSTIGFGQHLGKKEDESFDAFEHVSQDDLKRFGLIPEFVGRFPVLANVKPLDTDALVRILVEPKNSILKQYTAMFAVDNLKLCFEESALKRIAEIANKIGTGARALRSVIEEVLNDFVYEYGGSDGGQLTINVNDVEKSLKKRYETYF